jgi:hypothetical protein
MAEEGEASFATRFFRRRPDLLGRVLGSAEFGAWLGRHKAVVVDGITYFVVGGDMLRDRDEMALTWARRNAVVSEEEIDHARLEEDG